eukprot:12947306-Ditylum_brightwellii.AAC.1
MIKFQQLFDQILASCHSSLPRTFVQTFNYMDARVQFLLGSLFDDVNVQWWLMPLVYESLAVGMIRETISWPLIFWSNPGWYVERSLDELLKPTSLQHQIDLELGDIDTHPIARTAMSQLLFCWKAKDEGLSSSRLQRLVHVKGGRQSALLGTNNMQDIAYYR